MTAFVTAQCRPRLPGAAGGGGRATCAHSRLTGTKDGTQQEEHLFLPLGTDTESPAIPSRFLDGQGSTRTLTDETGAVVATFVYDSHGNLVASTGAASTAYKYVGNQRYRAEVDLGLIWIGCRHYDPEVGRWTTEDTWLGDLLVPESLNRYVYCGGDPVNRTDASGMCWIGVVGAVLAIGGAIVACVGVATGNPLLGVLGAVVCLVGVFGIIYCVGFAHGQDIVEPPPIPDAPDDPGPIPGEEVVDPWPLPVPGEGVD